MSDLAEIIGRHTHADALYDSEWWEANTAHQDLVLLTSYMADQDYSASDIAYAVEKPWKFTDILAAAKNEDEANRQEKTWPRNSRSV